MGTKDTLRGRRTHGSVYRRRRGDGTFYDGWFVRFVEGGQRVQRGGFSSKDAAETYLAARRIERSEGRALGMPDLRRISVKELHDEFIAWSKDHRRPNTLKSQKTMLGAFIAHGSLAKRDAVSIRGDDVLQWLAAMRRDRKWTPITQHAALTAVAAMYRFAAENNVVRASPTQGIRGRLPRVDVQEPPYVPPDELRVIYAAMPPKVRTCVMLMGEAGLRRNEAVGLMWSEVAHDLSRVTIRAERSKSHRARTVPLTEVAREALRAERRTTPMGDARVFPDLTPHRLNEHFREAADKIGRRDIWPHTLRHAFASGLVRAGVDLSTVQRLMGHQSIAMTMRYGCHAPGNAADMAIRALEASRRAPTQRQTGSEPR